jgi:phosphate transport system permease protein
MRRRLEEIIFQILMIASLVIVAGSLAALLGVVLWRGLPVLKLSMLTQVAQGSSGGILNAIIGSLYLGLGATFCAALISLPVAFYLQKGYSGRSSLAAVGRLSLDVLWGVPSIVYGAFGFLIMLYLGMRASLLGGIIALTFVEVPIMARAMDEAIRIVPQELKESAYALGSTRLEVTLRVVLRQALPGILTAILLAFGRGIGDAAAVLFTAGYSDYIPASLMESAASLPLTVFSQSQDFSPEAQQHAYASAAVLLAIVLIASVLSRWLCRRFERHVIR